MAPRKANLVACILSASVLIQNPSAVDVSQIYSDNERATVFIESIAHLFNGTSERMTGTGFFISDSGAVLTNEHVTFRNKSDYKDIAITVRVGSRNAPPVRAAVEWSDRPNDLAILGIDSSDNIRRVALGKSSAARIGSRVVVMGFPLAADLSIVDGIISSKPSPSRWQTSAALNLGNSGGPVFNAAGEVIGIVTSGVVSVVAGDVGPVDVDGIGYFVPIDVIRDLKASPAVPGFLHVEGARPPAVPRVRRLSRAYAISEMKDDHPVVFAPHSREYTREFAAEPGFRIVSARVEILSQNFMSGLRPTVSENGRTVTVRFTLRSGPAIDRYRGWLHATVITEQERDGVS